MNCYAQTPLSGILFRYTNTKWGSTSMQKHSIYPRKGELSLLTALLPCAEAMAPTPYRTENRSTVSLVCFNV